MAKAQQVKAEAVEEPTARDLVDLVAELSDNVAELTKVLDYCGKMFTAVLVMEAEAEGEEPQDFIGGLLDLVRDKVKELGGPGARRRS